MFTFTSLLQSHAGQFNLKKSFQGLLPGHRTVYCVTICKMTNPRGTMLCFKPADLNVKGGAKGEAAQFQQKLLTTIKTQLNCLRLQV